MCCILAVEGEQDGQQHDADYKGHRNQGQTSLYIVVKFVAAETHNHGVGGHTDGGRIGAGAGDDGGDDHGAGVSAQALSQRGGDGYHQGGGGGVGHEVGQNAADNKDDQQQDDGVGIGAQGTHDGIGNQAACTSGFQRLGKGQRAAEQEHHLQIDGLERFLLRDNAGENEDDGSNAGGDLNFHTDLLFKDHGEDYNHQNCQGNELLPLGYIGVILLGFHSLTSLGSVRQEAVTDEGEVDNSCQQHGNANRGVHEETGFYTHFLQSVDTHQVAGCADDGQVAAQCCREDQRHQQPGAGVAGLVSNTADHGNQHSGGAGVGQEARHNADDYHDGNNQHPFGLGELGDQTANLCLPCRSQTEPAPPRTYPRTG